MLCYVLFLFRFKKININDIILIFQLFHTVKGSNSTPTRNKTTHKGY